MQEHEHGVIEFVDGPQDGIRFAICPPVFPPEWVSAQINPADCIYDPESGQMRVPVAKIKRFVYARTDRLTESGAKVYVFSRRLT